MDWQQIREMYPHRWLIMEAVDAKEVNQQLLVNELEVIADFGEDGSGALKRTSEMSRRNQHRTYIFYHTANPSINIEVKYCIGPLRRPAWDKLP